jgi:hypothetical protein
MNDEEMLRRILTAEAETVDVAPDALGQIRTKIARRRARVTTWLPRGLAMVAFTGGTAAVAAAIVALVLIGVPRVQGTTPPTSNAGAGAPPSANLPVYYAGATSTGPRLYREYHPLLVADLSPAGETEAAVEELLTPHSAFDPDYSTPWPAGVSVHGVRVDGDTATVDLSGVPAGYADRMSLEQLVWTVTAITGVPNVRLLVDGQGTGAALQRGLADEVLAPVWLIDPQQDAPVGHAITVKVAGHVVDGVVHVRVRTAAGVVVSDQPVRLSGAPTDRGEATLPLNLPSGTYVVEAYAGQDVDGHQVVVP